MNHDKRSSFFGLAATLLIAVGIALAMPFSPAQAQQEPSLADMALKGSDLDQLPGVSGSRLIKSTPSLADDLSQPLSNRYGLATGMTAYIQAYIVGGVIGDGKYSAYVGNYLYRYRDPAHADAAADQWIKLVLQYPQSKSVDVKSPVPPTALRGQAAMTIGSEGDAIYWFAGAKGRTLILLMVNGMPVSSTPTTFQALVSQLMQ